MHLKSIELQEVGVFSDAVRLDHLSPGLNVLSGRNELGKSTLLRGLLSLFLASHRSTKREIKELRPYRGGAPRIACEFELDGHDWWLEKQFLASPSALLRRADGSKTYPGVDAESHLEDLFRKCDLAQNLSLLWPQQGAQSLEVPQPGDDVRQSIGTLLSVEVESASGLGTALATLKMVHDELGELVTKTERPKKGGPYHKLLSEHEDVLRKLEQARQVRTAAEQRLQELSELQREEAELSDAGRQRQLDVEIEDLSERHVAAGKVERQLMQLADKIQLLEKQQKNCDQAFKVFHQERSDVEAVAVLIKASEPKLTEMNTTSVALRQQLAELATRIDEAQASATDLNQRRERVHQARVSRDQRARLVILQAQQSQVATLESEKHANARRLSELTWPDDTLDQLHDAVREKERLDDRIGAEAPRIAFAYDAGHSTGFKVAGEAVPDGTQLIANQPMIVEIAGIGTITVSPGLSDSVATLNSSLDDASGRISELLIVMGADDTASAATRDLERRNLTTRQHLLAAELQGIAPQGSEILHRDITELQGLLQDVEEPPPGADRETLEDLDQLAKTVSDQLAELRTRHETLRQQQVSNDQKQVQEHAQIQERREQHQRLLTKMEQREGDAEKTLSQELEQSQTALNEVVREKIALSEVALSTEAMTALTQALEIKRMTKANNQERLDSVRQRMRLIEGLLQRDFADGVADQESELAERAAELDDQLQDMAAHIAALKLLSREIAAEIATQRQQVAKPLAGRMVALTSTLWQSADLELSSNLHVEGISRSGTLESVDVVSAGTREQIALLARLAYAGLVAEGPIGLPVILDDPLVFSDDSRLEAVFDVLAAAAEVHQIIILTCHERAFEPLVKRPGVNQLSLQGRT